jgi:hypothetical protein
MKMDLVAVMILVIVGLFSLIFLAEQEYKTVIIMWSVILFCQLFWFPIVFSEYKTEIKTFITNQYKEVEFSEPVEITEIRKYKKMSAFFDKTTVEIKVIP